MKMLDKIILATLSNSLANPNLIATRESSTAAAVTEIETNATVLRLPNLKASTKGILQ